MKNAFTLVELSIVLVILGLLVGGVLAGQNLIRAAELRAVTSEYAQFQTAAMTFKEKYFAIPGDMDNATAFWGTAASCPGDYTSPSTDERTCNGNGDGQVISSGGGPEGARFWHHLANAGLIEGTYTGTTSDVNGYNFGAVGEINVPLSKANSEWVAASLNSIDNSSTHYIEGSYGNVFVLNEYHSFITPSTDLDPLTPEEAWSIDKKMDDGTASMGNIVTLERNAAACNSVGTNSSSSIAASVTYNFSITEKSCGLVFKNAY